MPGSATYNPRFSVSDLLPASDAFRGRGV